MTATVPTTLLFHGTSTKFLRKIMRHGLRPRDATGNSVYAGREIDGYDLESHPGLVYLTDIYAIHFGLIAANKYGGKVLVCGVEVDLESTQPDTDFQNAATGEDCLQNHGTCCINASSLSPRVMWTISRKRLWETLGENPEIHAGLKHRAFRDKIKAATDFLLMCHDERWRLVDGEWEKC